MLNLPKKAIFIVLMFAAVAAAQADQDAAITEWSSDDIHEKIEGNTVMGDGWSMFVGSDGRLAGREGGSRDSGLWYTNADNLFCRTWKSWGQGKESCFQITSKGKTLKFKRRNGPTSTFYGQLLSGNAGKL